MAESVKRLGVIGVLVAVSVLLLFAFSRRPPPNTSLHVGFAGPSIVEAGGVLFTLTNQTSFPVRFKVWVETSGPQKSKSSDSGGIHPYGTYTFHVIPSGTNQWRIVGSSWEPATLKPGFVRSRCVQLLSKLTLDRLATRLAEPPPNGRILGPEMLGNGLKTAL